MTANEPNLITTQANLLQLLVVHVLIFGKAINQLITIQTIISGHMTGIITHTKESETVHFNTEMLDSNDSD